MPDGQSGKPQSTSSDKKTGPKILLVEDLHHEPSDLQKRLSEEGFQVTYSTDYLETLNLLQNDDQFSLVLADVILGSRSGLDLLLDVKKIEWGCPVVLMTSYPSMESSTKALRRGAFDYIVKPVEQRVLLSSINRAHEFHQLQEQNRWLQKENEIHRKQLQLKVEAQARRIQASYDKLRERDSDLQHTLRVASLGVLTAGIAHEINQPLNSAKVEIDSMLYWHEVGKIELPDDIVQKCQKVTAEINRISRIVQNTSSLARDRAGLEKTSEVIDLPSSIQSSLELCKNFNGFETLKVHIDIPDGLPSIQGEQTFFEQVILNLVKNSIQAMESQEPDSREVFIRAKTHRDKVILELEDTGPGIPEEMRKEVFEPLTTGKKRHGNLGLGLAIVKRYLTLMDASIDLSSSPDSSALFTLEFQAS